MLLTIPKPVEEIGGERTIDELNCVPRTEKEAAELLRRHKVELDIGEARNAQQCAAALVLRLEIVLDEQMFAYEIARAEGRLHDMQPTPSYEGLPLNQAGNLTANPPTFKRTC